MGETKKKNKRLSTILYWTTLVSFILALIYIPVRVALSEDFRTQYDWKLMFTQTFFGLIILNLPSMMEKKFKWKIPNFLISFYNIFLWCSIFLGEVMDFYFRIPFWDNILHFMSSVMLGILGFSMIEILNNDKKHSLVNLSPFFVAVFAVAFAILCGVLWEIYEFTFDGVLGLNMQKFKDSNLEELVGREALKDTMEDLIIDFLGATVAAIAGYISLKNRREFIDAFRIEVFHTESVTAEVKEKKKHSWFGKKKDKKVEKKCEEMAVEDGDLQDNEEAGKENSEEEKLAEREAVTVGADSQEK